MRSISRRTFLWVLFGGGMAVAAGTAAWSWLRGDPAAIVIAVVRRRLGFLEPTAETLDAFARDYLDTRSRYRGTLAKLAFLAGPLRIYSPYDRLPMGHALRRLEDNVVSHFLLSTDFFEYGADESRAPLYVGFHDPSERPCRNPFARRPDPR